MEMSVEEESELLAQGQYDCVWELHGIGVKASGLTTRQYSTTRIGMHVATIGQSLVTLRGAYHLKG